MRKSTKVFLGLTAVAILAGGVAFLSSGFDNWDKDSWQERLKPDKTSEEPISVDEDPPIAVKRKVYIDLNDVPWWDGDLVNAYPGIYYWGGKTEGIWPGEKMLNNGTHWYSKIPETTTHIIFTRINVADPNQAFNQTIDITLSENFENKVFKILETVDDNGAHSVDVYDTFYEAAHPFPTTMVEVYSNEGIYENFREVKPEGLSAAKYSPTTFLGYEQPNLSYSKLTYSSNLAKYTNPSDKAYGRIQLGHSSTNPLVNDIPDFDMESYQFTYYMMTEYAIKGDHVVMAYYTGGSLTGGDYAARMFTRTQDEGWHLYQSDETYQFDVNKYYQFAVVFNTNAISHKFAIEEFNIVA